MEEISQKRLERKREDIGRYIHIYPSNNFPEDYIPHPTSWGFSLLKYILVEHFSYITFQEKVELVM